MQSVRWHALWQLADCMQARLEQQQLYVVARTGTAERVLPGCNVCQTMAWLPDIAKVIGALKFNRHLFASYANSLSLMTGKIPFPFLTVSGPQFHVARALQPEQ